MKNRWWLLLICVMLIFVLFLPPTNAPDVDAFKKKEAFHQQKIAALERNVKVLDSRDVAWTKLVEATRDTLRRERAVVAKLKREYVKAQEPIRYSLVALDSVFGVQSSRFKVADSVYGLPIDTVRALLNDRKELASARPLIVRQDRLINMGLRYESRADSLLSIRLNSIEVRDSIIVNERERFTNMIVMKDATIRHERRQKRKYKAAVAVIVVVEVLREVFRP